MTTRPLRTRVRAVSPEHPDATFIAEAADVLKTGGLVAFPTETVYGLGANALDAAAVAGIFVAKGRPSTDPLIVHLRGAQDLAIVARDLPPMVDRLAARFWPGPLTLILPRQAAVPASVSAGLATVGVRVPAHPVARALIEAAGVPVAAPSANLFSRPSPTQAAHVLADLDGRIDLVLDAGSTSVGVESTVLDLTVSPPLVRRPGGVSVEALRDVLPDVQVAARPAAAAHPGAAVDAPGAEGEEVAEVAGEDVAQVAPGQLLRHYAPRATLTFIVGETGPSRLRTLREVGARLARGRSVGLLVLTEDADALAPAPRTLSEAPLTRMSFADARTSVRVRSYGSHHDAAGAARQLFDALRRLDAEGVDEILALAPAPDGIGLAIHDRLTRAAEGRVITAD